MKSIFRSIIVLFGFFFFVSFSQLLRKIRKLSKNDIQMHVTTSNFLQETTLDINDPSKPFTQLVYTDKKLK